jgi:hypothetical protein
MGAAWLILAKPQQHIELHETLIHIRKPVYVQWVGHRDNLAKRTAPFSDHECRIPEPGQLYDVA